MALDPDIFARLAVWLCMPIMYFQLKTERVNASKIIPSAIGNPDELIKDRHAFFESVKQALYASKIVSYAQGFMLLRAAGEECGWALNMGAISLMWRGGCIIRSRFLGRIKEAYDRNPNLTNLLLDEFFLKAINECIVS